ncbi:hypothetical protein [Nocardia otitidiscaviarum]|uniref:hypothetical protein n=1 Tax=Nocardia otitidiscaviarum TaxID=1823 RepID=UPI00189572B9|nr:hypothetical protein [Nocardia otitidiscaviarum]MBF6178333.1 hypothetical protein [Nocardia otitidiscaviarum]
MNAERGQQLRIEPPLDGLADLPTVERHRRLVLIIGESAPLHQRMHHSPIARGDLGPRPHRLRHDRRIAPLVGDRDIASDRLDRMQNPRIRLESGTGNAADPVLADPPEQPPTTLDIRCEPHPVSLVSAARGQSGFKSAPVAGVTSEAVHEQRDQS